MNILKRSDKEAAKIHNIFGNGGNYFVGVNEIGLPQCV
jgi:hypothetical protein